MAVPARFRSVLSDADRERNYVLIRGHENCLFMYTHRQFGRIKDNVRRQAEQSGYLAFFREFMARAVAIDLDTQGRFTLPADLMREVGIRGPGVLFIGMDDRIEIWEPSVYQARRDEGGAYDETLRKTGERIFGI